jgi:hypothetical protein
MKPPLTLLSALLLGFGCLAQHKSSLEISAGISLPAGDFADKDMPGDKSGLAKTGQTVSIAYQHLLSKKIGFAVSLSGYRNPLDVASLETSLASLPVTYIYFSSQPGLPPPPSSIPPRDYHWQSKKDAWLTGSLLVGPYIELPIGMKTSFVGQVTAGAAYIQSPAVHMISVTDTVTAHLEQTDPHAISFAYALDGGIAHKLSNKISLVATLRYFGTPRAKFEDVRVTVSELQGTGGSLNFLATSSVRTTDGRQAISTINVAAGLRLSL